MDMDVNAVNEGQLQIEGTDDSCRVDFRDTGDSCTVRECVSGDWFGEARDTGLAALKQEPDDVCCVFYPTLSLFQQKEFIQIVGNTSSFGTISVIRPHRPYIRRCGLLLPTQ